MATTMGITPDPNDRSVVNYDEPPIKPPPVLMVGPLAWIRTNLFKSTFDTIVTIISFIVLVTVVSAVLRWGISQANWFVVTINLRLFLVGTFPLDSLWRLEWAARLCAFVIGFTLFAYTRVSRVFVIILAIMLALLFVVPPLVYAAAPPVTSYLAVGETPVVSGTVTEAPQQQVGFIARAGETITVRVADIAGDNALAQIAGFTDRASGALVNAAANRLQAQQTQIDLQNRLDRGLLTDTQRADLTTQLNSLQIPDAVTETYQLNQQPVEIAILDATLEALVTSTLTADSEPLTFTLPDDGWYILRKSSDSEALLKTTGIYPLNENNFSRPLSSGGSTTVTQYVRMSDGFTSEAIRPKVDGQNVPELIITDNQYQGMRPLGDYLSLFIAPFFRDLAFPVLQLAALGALGYGASLGLARILPPVTNERGDQRKRARGATTWLWLVWLIALFVLCYGIPSLDIVGVALLISRFVWLGWIYFAGMNDDRPRGRMELRLVTLLGIVQAVRAEGVIEKVGAVLRGESASAAVIALVFTAIWLIAGLYVAQMGRSQRVRWDDQTRRRTANGIALVWLILFLLPPLLVGATPSDTVSNLLPVTDTRRWGGFLLTALLTIVGIIASFPIGVLLALGRRSSLPVVRWTCVIYIELVRGVPFLTILFMAQLLVPLVNPGLAEVPNVFRAMVGTTLFSAAYLAENVRGGLQAIPHGQEEAAKALGLGGYQVTLYIMLPQALRIVIPALVGQAIALFKDTSLVALVGLIDLTGMAQSVVAQAEFIGLQKEVYFFISLIYFVFSYLMAWVSRRIESSGSGAARRV